MFFVLGEARALAQGGGAEKPKVSPPQISTPKPAPKHSNSSSTPRSTPRTSTSQPSDADVAGPNSEDPAFIGRRSLFSYPGTDLSGEHPLARSLSVEVLSRNTFTDDSVVNEYMNRVGQNIVLHSDARVPFTIKVIDSTSMNAFALPDGYLFITVGLILSVNNEAELAGLIAHQIAHCVAHHGIVNSLKTGSKSLEAFTTFNRTAEEQADKLAVQYLYATGYDPGALASGSGAILNSGQWKAENVAASFTGHPLTTDRIVAVRELVGRFPRREQYVINTPDFFDIKRRLTK